MSLATSPVTGTIRIAPLPLADGGGRAAADDSTLELLLAAFATGESLSDAPLGDEVPLRLIACTRLSRSSFHDHATVTVKANLSRLLVDLQDEYDRLAVASSGGRA